jgi:two-component system LytT family response regulator
MNVLIADDEPLARRRLARLLSVHTDVNVVAQCTTGKEAARCIHEHRPQAAFLDIRMPGLSGFETLAEVDPALAPHVVFVTAHHEYAVRAFDVEAVDYILKPVDGVRLSAALDRLRARLTAMESPDPGAGGPDHTPVRRLLLKDGSGALMVSTHDINWIEADGNYVKIHTSDRVHLARRTLTGLEKILDPERFVRIHRSTLVNLDRVKRLAPGYGGSYLVLLYDGTELTLSRGFRHRLLGRLGESL